MSIRFVRRGDGVAYEFRRERESPEDELVYRRVDLELFCRRLPDFGWCVVDPTGQVLSRPFDGAGTGALPPVGAWVSRKGDAAYVYDLRMETGEG
ncbi:hypothetical protein H7J06_03200 [Mycobacterium hodleri]|uniref:hypothetical protein n=1 Tax=Mycolicibacterium hodleri TaxID=49897 RepID=UPI0021F31F91|nr:hypothetical protein [Mycolicibacterium hodleri]MCV7131978.1 hypothetical protein [Mycolicibacterium hodleri]